MLRDEGGLPMAWKRSYHNQNYIEASSIPESDPFLRKYNWKLLDQHIANAAIKKEEIKTKETAETRGRPSKQQHYYQGHSSSSARVSSSMQLEGEPALTYTTRRPVPRLDGACYRLQEHAAPRVHEAMIDDIVIDLLPGVYDITVCPRDGESEATTRRVVVKKDEETVLPAH